MEYVTEYKLTCSMFLSVVGVNVDVVLVGTPLWIPSNETSCKMKQLQKKTHTFD